MKLFILLSFILSVLSWNPFAKPTTNKATMSSGGFYKLKEKSATGKTIDFNKEFAGKVVYGVNVASR